MIGPIATCARSAGSSEPPHGPTQFNADCQSVAPIKRTRKTSRGLALKKAIEKNGGKPLSVEFDTETWKSVFANAEKFNNEIGQQVRDLIPLTYTTWKSVPPSTRARLVNKVQDEGGEKDSDAPKTKVPKDVKSAEEWEKLCDYWRSEKQKRDPTTNELQSLIDQLQDMHQSRQINEQVRGTRSGYIKGIGRLPRGDSKMLKSSTSASSETSVAIAKSHVTPHMMIILLPVLRQLYKDVRI
ncbi:hypothetical protein TorRG33x02_356640 [Trema orientale]|uniref:Transposase, Ptta/En/Spm, plant n=1 Tax=Trema orientale TaxID=63057 RepID=A0A2P5A6V7_TREOI|nr:hypothetical protein TorRG33x02_356640 [Trema orientale]